MTDTLSNTDFAGRYLVTRGEPRRGTAVTIEEDGSDWRIVLGDVRKPSQVLTGRLDPRSGVLHGEHGFYSFKLSLEGSRPRRQLLCGLTPINPKATPESSSWEADEDGG